MSRQKNYSKDALASALKGYSTKGPQAISPPQAPPPDNSLPEDKTIAPQVNPQVAQATAQAVQTGANPGILDKAKGLLGDQNFIGLCEKFVEVATQGKSGVYSSAAQAWNDQKDKAVPLAEAKPGDAIYFAPDASNEGFGHTGVYTGNGNMISATNSGVKETPLTNWTSSTGQKVLGVIPRS